MIKSQIGAVQTIARMLLGATSLEAGTVRTKRTHNDLLTTSLFVRKSAETDSKLALKFAMMGQSITLAAVTESHLVLISARLLLKAGTVQT